MTMRSGRVGTDGMGDPENLRRNYTKTRAVDVCPTKLARKGEAA